MAGSISIPVAAQSVKFVPESDTSRMAKVWEPGKSFAERASKVDAKGRPLHQFAALVEVAGARLGSVMVESPIPLPDSLGLGVVFQGTGTASLAVSNNSDGFDLRTRLTLEGFEPTKQ